MNVFFSIMLGVMIDEELIIINFYVNLRVWPYFGIIQSYLINFYFPRGSRDICL